MNSTSGETKNNPTGTTIGAVTIIGRHPRLHELLNRVALLAPTHMPVLVTGESGTGKELVARLMHELGARPNGPFVAVNCGALPRELAESELFGHERGSFTGAAGRRQGWFEEANGGTLVLDEIGELPRDLQPKLLRVLETGCIRRVGGHGEVPVNVRVIAMTLRNLRKEVELGTFREDLYHRLSVLSVPVPSLRERRSDIPLLAQHFQSCLEPQLGRRELDPEALQALEDYDWPGNVRELRNVIFRAAVLTKSRISVADLELPHLAPPPRVSEWSTSVTAEPHLYRIADAIDSLQPANEPAPRANETSVPSRTDWLCLKGLTFNDIERQAFAWAMERNGGSRRQAAKALGVSRSTFCEKVKRYGLG